MKTHEITKTINGKEVTTVVELDQYGKNISDDGYNDGTKRVKVGMFCNYFGYSDAQPFEVVEVNKSGKTITIREVKAELKKSFKPKFHVGGYSAHCSNQSEQDYNYFTVEKGFTTKIRLSKKGWGKGDYRISATPHKFYDYNF